MIKRINAIFLFCVAFLFSLGLLFYYVCISPIILFFKRLKAKLGRNKLKREIDKLNKKRNQNA